MQMDFGMVPFLSNYEKRDCEENHQYIFSPSAVTKSIPHRLQPEGKN